jgi:hypothetical protein
MNRITEHPKTCSVFWSDGEELFFIMSNDVKCSIFFKTFRYIIIFLTVFQYPHYSMLSTTWSNCSGISFIKNINSSNIIWKSVTCHCGRYAKWNRSYPVNLVLSFTNSRNSSLHTLYDLRVHLRS